MGDSMSFRTMGEFRKALGKLAKPNGRLAKRNMAFPKIIDGIPFDSMEELVAFKKMMAAEAEVESTPPRRTEKRPLTSPFSGTLRGRVAPTRAQRREAAETQLDIEPRRAPKKRGPKPEKMAAAFSPPSLAQAQGIRRALGGSLFALCGEDWHRGLELSQADILAHKYPQDLLLARMGIDSYQKAHALISALETAGVYRHNTGKENILDRDQARDIAMNHGMLCLALLEDEPKKAKRNSGYMIPLPYPRKDYEFSAPPRVAHWTSYPQYAYDQFYRPIDARMPWVGSEASANPRKRKRAKRNPAPVSLPRSTFPAKPVDWPVADNAGPFLPQMFPYGLRGKPVTYALNNRGISQAEREEASAVGMTLSGDTSWPVPDEKHALIALDYMAKGRGKRHKYKSYLRKLFQLYPKSEYPRVNAAYKRLKSRIDGWM